MLKRWDGFAALHCDDGRICLTNNAAERAIRGLRPRPTLMALCRLRSRCGSRRPSWLTLIATAKLNNIDPQAWLADVLARIADMPQNRLDELLPWNWTVGNLRIEKAAA